jgi:ABC-2 type transport system permease protein
MSLYKEVIRYLKIYLVFIKNCLIGEMEYRANFIGGIAIESGYTLVKILYVGIIYNTGANINGLTPDEVLFYVGTYTLITGFFMGLIWRNIIQFSEHIRTGTLDIYLTKPLSTQFFVTLRKVNIGYSIPHFISGIWMLVIATDRLNLKISLTYVVGYMLLIFSGLIVTYSILLFLQLFCFWLVNTTAITDLTNELWEFNNMPMHIYSEWIQRVGIFVFPIFIVSNFPSLLMLGKLHSSFLIWGLVAPIIFFALTRIFWNFAIKRYASASV